MKMHEKMQKNDDEEKNPKNNIKCEENWESLGNVKYN